MKEFNFTDKARNQPSTLEWTVKVIERGDTYGKDGVMRHDQFDPLVEFWHGEFSVSRYYLSELLWDEGGIWLDGYDYRWSITDEGMAQVRAFLRGHHG